MQAFERGIMTDVEWRSPAGRLAVRVCLAVLIVASVITIFPFIYSFTAGLKTSTEIFKPGLNLWPQAPNWGNYVEAWQRFNMPRMFANSAIAAGGGVIGQILVSSLAAYSLSRLKPAGQRLIQALLLATLAIPAIAYLLPRYITLTDLPVLHVSLLNSWWGLWIPYAVNPFMLLVLKNAFDRIPAEIFEAAEVDGASQLRLFMTFALPLTRSLILVIGLLTFIGLWGDFLWPYLMLKDAELQTVSVRLFTQTRTFPANLFQAASFITMLPPAVAAILVQRYLTGELAI